MSARAKLPDTLKPLLRSELEKAIYEAALDSQDSLIAERYLIEKVPQIDIAAELGYERSTISRRLTRIIKSVEHAAARLGLT